jgi:hypothetical protein
MIIEFYCGEKRGFVDTLELGYSDDEWRQAAEELRFKAAYRYLNQQRWLPATGWRYPEVRNGK